jgi:Leucine-rich repeat (LRR) protein
MNSKYFRSLILFFIFCLKFSGVFTQNLTKLKNLQNPHNEIKIQLYKSLTKFSRSEEISTSNISCIFHNFSPNFYICELSINNSETFTTIKGQHSPSKSDWDVTQVHLNGNFTNFSAIICNQFRNLKKIFAIKVQIEKISENSFENCSSLIHLDLEGNKISEISFEGLKSLEILNLKANEISEFNFEVFNDLENLRELNLAENSIKNLPNEIFEPLLDSLEKISLRKNDLENSWNSEWLKNSQKLKYFDIGENNLTEIEENSFNSSKIFAFLIDKNLIEILDTKSFENFLNIQFFMADGNKLNFIDQKIILWENLKFLGLSNNTCTDGNFMKENLDLILEELKVCFENFDNRPLRECKNLFCISDSNAKYFFL